MDCLHLLFPAIASLLCVAIAANLRHEPLSYPETRKDDVSDDYFGTSVADPYRWLEDANAEETAEWVARQNEVTYAYLNQIPERAALLERLTELYNYPRYSLPFKDGGRTFFFRNNGLQNQKVLYVQDTPEAEPRLLLDPNALSEDGTVALNGLSVSEDGNLLVYALSRG
ncbi:MAG: prolyl endopeptidase, partial [Chthonomonadaceae bacterium]|nr:prolyl endopeptidase [Chthonomonadaceae bacterium]